MTPQSCYVLRICLQAKYVIVLAQEHKELLIEAEWRIHMRQ